jgi:hypothetical protein
MELLNLTFESELAADGTQMSNSLHQCRIGFNGNVVIAETRLRVIRDLAPSAKDAG